MRVGNLVKYMCLIGSLFLALPNFLYFSGISTNFALTTALKIIGGIFMTGIVCIMAAVFMKRKRFFKKNREKVVLSGINDGFGNPYNNPYEFETVREFKDSKDSKEKDDYAFMV